MDITLLHVLSSIILMAYIILTVLTLIGQRETERSGHTHEPYVSVIIVAQNEEASIADCLQSLGAIDYPDDKLEIILVNDRSTDRTGHLMKTFARSHTHTRVITMGTNPAPFTGKLRGLIKGVKMSSGSILLFTDGDCIVPPQWIKTTISGYDQQTGLVGGFLLLDKKNGKFPVFARLQSIDWLLITAVGSAWGNLGFPLSIFGNNFSVKKETLDRIGGFETLSNHLTEDFALIKKVREETHARINILLDPGSCVFTRPVRNVRSFLLQRKRWFIGGRNLHPVGSLLIGSAIMAHVIVPLLLAAGETFWAFICLAVFVVSDVSILYRPFKILGRFDLFKWIPLFELYYFCYSLFYIPILLFGRKIRWKSEVISRQFVKPD